MQCSTVAKGSLSNSCLSQTVKNDTVKTMITHDLRAGDVAVNLDKVTQVARDCLLARMEAIILQVVNSLYVCLDKSGRDWIRDKAEEENQIVECRLD